MNLDKLPYWMAQVPVTTPIGSPEEASLVFSGPRFFIALIAGVVLAFALQLLLTNASVAFGLSFLGNYTDPDSNNNDRDQNRDSDNSDSGSLGSTINKIGTAVGLWTLITVTIALFIACLLAVRLSLILDPGLAAIVGLVIWATYFSLLVWVSSTTVGSFIGSVINTATSGFQSIVGTAAAAIGAQAASSQVVATAEAAASAVRRELTAGFDPEGLREKVEDYIESLRPPELDVKGIRQEFESILNDPQLKEIAATGGLANIDRQQLINLVSNRTDLSKRDINRIVDQLEGAWKQTVGQVKPQQPDWLPDLVNYLKTANPQQLTQEISGKLDDLIATLRNQQGQGQSGQGGGSGQGQQGQSGDGNSNPGLMEQAVRFGLNQVMGGGQQGQGGGSGMMNPAAMLAFNTLMATVMGRADLSDLSVEKILEQLRSAKDKATEQVDKVAEKVTGEAIIQPFSTIRADVENYLLNTYSWKMKRETIAQDFKDVLYDPQADPKTVRQEVEQLKKSDFLNLLSQRGVFTQDKIDELAEQLEEIRQEVLHAASVAEEQEKALDARRRVEGYVLLTKKEDLTTEAIDRDFKQLLEDSDADVDTLRDRFNQFDRATLVELLNQRGDLSAEEIEEVANHLEASRDRAILAAEDLATQAKAQAETLWLNLESYLQNTGKEELNPEGIKRDLQQLLEDPQAGVWSVRARMSRFDRDTLVQLLSQRQDLSEEQVNQVIDKVQDTWSSILHAPQAVAEQAKDQYDQITTAIADYLRNTGIEELNPEAIQRDLTTLLNNPQLGFSRLSSRLSQVDRDTLVQLLSQRQDLSEEQINQTIDQVQGAIRNVIRAPRRLAARTQSQVQDFQTTLEDYLRNTGKQELNPEGLKRDIQLLLNDPRVGIESLSERLSRIDRETLISLLSQRSDMSEAEAARVVDSVLGIREQFVEQIRSIESRIQGVIDGVFDRIRGYLNSLNRPELNYDGIKRDVRTLIDDPQAGFDALRDRLGHFNRDTLVAVMSSREDISEADANRLVDQIEGVRTNILQRAERMQTAAQQRLEDVKRQAQKQADETRKAAASAAWWLFWTAISSGGFSALGGALAVFLLR